MSLSPLAQAVPYIEASLQRSNPAQNTLEGVLSDIVSGQAHLWTGQDSVIVTQPVFSHRIWHAGGEMPDMIDTMQRIWPHMVASGAHELRIDNTRKGWLKKLRPHGFEQVISLIKEA